MCPKKATLVSSEQNQFKHMLEHLTTESRNPASEDVDALSPLEIVRLINAEDARVAAAVGEQADSIARAIEVIAERLAAGGRLIYIGAGTSGRLGVLDAVECPPTFNTDPKQVVGVIAGGHSALVRSIEGAEDRPDLAIEDLRRVNLSSADVLVGIATSGRTPYVLGSLDFARSVGAYAIGLCCNRDAEMITRADLSIIPVVGPEVVSGSTRMKAGTATKMVLNMLTTGAMIRLGKTYGNLMVDMRASNSKLADRARRIVRSVTKLSDRESQQLLDDCGGEVKTAIVSHYTGYPYAEARRLLAAADGHLRRALNEFSNNGSAS
jgi:N-acetylmuramic acid 6-phosphate etherase